MMPQFDHPGLPKVRLPPAFASYLLLLRRRRCYNRHRRHCHCCSHPTSHRTHLHLVSLLRFPSRVPPRLPPLLACLDLSRVLSRVRPALPGFRRPTSPSSPTSSPKHSSFPPPPSPIPSAASNELSLTSPSYLPPPVSSSRAKHWTRHRHRHKRRSPCPRLRRM